MPRVDNLLLTSDFDTLKSDDVKTAVVTIPGSSGVAAGATATFSALVNVGQAQSLTLVSVTNNVTYPAGDYSAISVPTRFDRMGGGATPYSIIVRHTHTGGNTVQVMASIFNNGASPLTTSATTDIFTFVVRTIRVPKFA